MTSLDAQYNSLLHTIRYTGVKKSSRSGDVISSFGHVVQHDMSRGFPLLTTKKMAVSSIMKELKWFLSGSTDIRDLWRMNVNIWDGDWYKNYKKWCDSPYLLSEMKDISTRPSGYHDSVWDLGAIYGKQWRDFNGVDQIKNLLDELRSNPDSRRLMVNAWNPSDIPKMTLPPCHYSFQLYTKLLTVSQRVHLTIAADNNFDILDLPLAEDSLDSVYHELLDTYNTPTRSVSLMWTQRSVDVPLGLCFNIASYGMLLELIAHEVNMVPDMLRGNLGDCHIYENQLDGVNIQTDRPGKSTFPSVKIISSDIMQGAFEYEMINYQHDDIIRFPLSN